MDKQVYKMLIANKNLKLLFGFNEEDKVKDFIKEAKDLGYENDWELKKLPNDLICLGVAE
jgi:uncharacterized protein (UPF0264 family)